MWNQGAIPIWKLQSTNTVAPPNPIQSWPPESGRYFNLYHQLRTQQPQQPYNYNRGFGGGVGDGSKHSGYKVSQIRCINCSKIGHLYRNCTSAVTSFGIIAVTKYDPNGPLLPATKMELKSQYLCPEHSSFKQIVNTTVLPDDLLFCMVQRKDTMGYIDFIRGKYPDSNTLRKEHLVNTFVGEMTCAERKRLLETPFDDIWEMIWSHHYNRSYIKQKEYKDAKAKFTSFDLQSLFESNPAHWPTHEWGFPKGRKNISESNIDCAIREFCEETGYESNNIILINSIPPIVEEFQGTNGLSYKHVWYCATVDKSVGTPSVNPNSHLQAGEIANVGWFTQDQCLSLFRSYEISKTKTLTKLINKYGDILKSSVFKRDSPAV